MVDTAPPVARPATTASARLAALDIARAAALLAMAVFHFVFDLELFGWLAPGTSSSGGWRVLALCTAGSFLFLAGVSLWLAHGRGIRWRGFAKRLAMVAGAAALISAATYVAMPQAFVFFGILHSIAASSLLGLLCLRLPAPVLIGLAGAAFWAPQALRSPAFDAPGLWWIGLQTAPITSVDYVPLLPWFGPFLLGLAAARIADRAGLWQALAARPAPGWQVRLGWPGRHSLAIYLIHQPVLIALVWLGTQMLR